MINYCRKVNYLPNILQAFLQKKSCRLIIQLMNTDITAAVTTIKNTLNYKRF